MARSAQAQCGDGGDGGGVPLSPLDAVDQSSTGFCRTASPLSLHDLARQERDQHELEVLKAQKRGKIVQPRRYYQDSYHLCYELLGQRNDITEIYGRPDAQAVLMRLRAIDDVINARARRGDGTAHPPRRPVGRAAGRHSRNRRSLREPSDGFRTPRSRARGAGSRHRFVRTAKPGR